MERSALSGQEIEELDPGLIHRKPEAPDRQAYHRRERGSGEFVRNISLPFRVDPDRVEATVQDGVLRISLHRPEQDKPKRIKVSAQR